MISDNTFKLLEEISKTNSVYKKKELILEFIAKEAIGNSSEDIDKLINSYQLAINIKSNQGKEYIKKRNYNKNKLKVTKNYPTPIFSSLSVYYKELTCNTCHQVIKKNLDNGGANLFCHQVNGTWYNYHCLPECFPAQYKDIMINNKGYIKFLEKK